MSNKAIMAFARQTLHGHWGSAVAIIFIYGVIIVAINAIPGIGWLITTVMSGPLIVGLNLFFISLVRNEPSEISQLFSGFSFFKNSLIALILIEIFVLLWSILLIVPGVIAAFSYSLTFSIIIDNPGISGLNAIKMSKEMMKGNKWKLFCLLFRFIGWFLLGGLTAGIGFLWIAPYMTTSLAKFYENILNSRYYANNQMRNIPNQVKNLTPY